MSETSLREHIERQWQSCTEKASEQGVELPGLTKEAWQPVWMASDFVVQTCVRQPALLAELLGDGLLTRGYEPGEMRLRLQECLAEVADETALSVALRRFRRREMLRIVWRDLDRSASLDETLEDLSELADVCVSEGLDRLYAWACAQQGVPRDKAGEAQTLLVLGMGKLGARELNLSSDIDLIFVYPHGGQTDGRRPLANEQFFTRLARALIKALNETTAEGFVFRVDARLRPFGDAGPLAVSFSFVEDYYQSQAREWERYAMVKARVIAGEAEHMDQLMDLLRPFVYRRYLDFGAIESIRDMKRMISRELHKRGMDANIKLGPGGIREIEFIGQAFQLIRGGRDPELQIRPIQPVLRLLADKELLPEYVVRELLEAYRFLRLTENRLQAWRDQQTHVLPEDEEGRLRLALSMGFESWEAFAEELDQHRRRVQGHFDKVFAAPQAEEDASAPDNPLLSVWQGDLDEAQAEHVLELAGFDPPAQARQQLQDFRESHACRALSERGRDRLEQLMPLLLEAVAGSEEAGTVLTRVLHLLAAIVRRSAYLSLLIEHPMALSQLVRLTAASPWIAEQLSRYPLLLDELLDPRRLYSPLHREQLQEELEVLLSRVAADDLEQQMEALRQFSHSNMLRVAAADITGQIPLMVVSDYLTEIAEIASSEVMRKAWGHMHERHGRPQDVEGEDTGFAVIGYGKLGGLELGYGSDLDLVFLHGSRSGNAMTDGARPIANDVFYARLGQRMIHLFTARTPSGQLYEVDMRLRPNGNSGLLVSSLNAFEAYQRNEAWTWEHQALLRARPIAGDPLVMARFEAIRREILGQPRDAQKLRAEVCEMREKMRTALDHSGADGFDVKQGVGGIADIEFMVQYAVLRWASQHPDLLTWTDNIRLLDSLAQHRLLEGQAAETLAEAYRRFRAVYHRNALAQRGGLMPDDQLAAERRQVREIWQSLMADPG